MQLDEPFECTSGGDPLLFYKNSAFNIFPSGTNSLCPTPSESKNPKWSWCTTFGIYVSSSMGISHRPIQNSVALFRGHRQNNRTHPALILFKKFVCIGHCDNVLARYVSIFPLVRCQAVWNKTCTQLSLSQVLFQNPKNYSFGDVKRSSYYSWEDTTIIFVQISNSSVYLSSSRFWKATSLVIFYQLTSVSISRIPSKNVWLVHSLIPISLLNQYQCFCGRQTGFETKFYDNSLFISAVHDVQRKLTLQDKL